MILLFYCFIRDTLLLFFYFFPSIYANSFSSLLFNTLVVIVIIKPSQPQ